MSTIGRSTAKLVMGRGVAMAIGFATAPVLTRLYAPEQFGLAELVMSVSMWVGAFACLGYALAMPLAKERSERRALVRLCLLLTAALAAAVVLITLGGAGPLARLMYEPALRRLLWFVPLLFVLYSVAQIAQYTCSAEGRFGLLSAAYLAQDGVRPPVQILLALVMGAGAHQLLWGTVAGYAGAALVATAVVIAILASSPTSDARHTLRSVAASHSQFPKAQLWSTVVNVASRSLPVLLAGAVFSPAMVGHYALGQKVLALPLVLLGMGVAQAFYPQAAREWEETQSVSHSMHRSVLALSTTCIFPIVAVGLLGPFLFQFVFGVRWREAGVYAQILAPGMLLSLIGGALFTVFLVVRRAGLGLAYNLVLLAARPTALLVGGWLGGERVAMACLSAAGGLVIAHSVLTATRLGRAAGGIAAMVARDTAYALALLLPSAVAWWTTGSTVLCLVLLGAATCVHGRLAYRRSPMLQAALRSLILRVGPGGAAGEPPVQGRT